MSDWWTEWKQWAFWCYGKLKPEARFHFLMDLMNVVTAAINAFDGAPFRKPLKLLKWAIQNPDPLQEARIEALAVKNRWVKRIAAEPADPTGGNLRTRRPEGPEQPI